MDLVKVIRQSWEEERTCWWRCPDLYKKKSETSNRKLAQLY